MSAYGYQRTSGTTPAQFRFQAESRHRDPRHGPLFSGVRESLDSGTPDLRDHLNPKTLSTRTVSDAQNPCTSQPKTTIPLQIRDSTTHDFRIQNPCPITAWECHLS